MATTGIRNGSGITIYFETDGSAPVVADHVTDLSVNASTDTRDTTTKNNGGYRALLPGLKTLTVNFTAMYAEDATNGYNELMTDYLLGAKQDVIVQSVAWSSGTATPVSGDTKITFEAYITSIELSAGVEDNATYTCTLECVSDITLGTIA
jgi:predicted secreted protein